MKPGLKFHLNSLVLLVLLVLPGCASVTGDIVPPRIQLIGLQLHELQVLEQRYLLKLRIQNPNDFDMDVQGVDFRVELNNEAFAQGITSKAVNIPRFGETVTQVLVSTNILNIARQMENGRLQARNTRYRISGRVKLGNLPYPVSFENEGDLASLLQRR